jgi:hypothetical protein
MLIVSTTGATNIGDEHEGVDGVFDVPQDVAEHLLSFPGWRYATEDEAAGFPVEAPSELKGAALEAALTAAGLPKTGTADEKRAALAEAASAPSEPQPVDESGKLIPTPEPTDTPEATPEATPAPSELKGDALAAALEEAGLPKTGTADEKRASLVENADS